MSPGIGQLEIFPSIWGHWAGGPGDSKEDVKWLDDHLSAWFASHGKQVEVVVPYIRYSDMYNSPRTRADIS